MKRFHVLASGAIQGHHGPLICWYHSLDHRRRISRTFAILEIIHGYLLKSFVWYNMYLHVHEGMCDETAIKWVQMKPIVSSTGRRPASLCHGWLSVMHHWVRPSVHLSVRGFTFSLNIFFSETTYRILMKFHRNVSGMVLFRISWKNSDSFKNSCCHGNKTEIVLKSLKIFLSETIRVRATKFGI